MHGLPKKKMTRLLLFLLLAAQASTLDMRAVIQSLEQQMSDEGYTRCHSLIKDYRMSFDEYMQTGGGQEDLPLTNMSIVYRDVGINNVYNITTAAKDILKEPQFNPNHTLYMFVHGYDDYLDADWYLLLLEALLEKGNSKALSLDAESLIRTGYVRSSMVILHIGERVGQFLADMVQMGVKSSAIHIMGISLGAHICGYIGKGFTKVTGTKVGRITGMDPARPCFSGADPDARLAATDAEFVDVIHTDIEMGIQKEIGQVNYYPNGGHDQPNCPTGMCNHGRSLDYFHESVKRPDAFPALKCQDWDSFKINKCVGEISSLGIAAKPGTTGKFYLRTADSIPFGLGEEGLRWEEEAPSD